MAALLLEPSECEIIALSINFTGRPRGELTSARAVAAALPVSDLIEVSLDLGARLTDPRYSNGPYEGWIPYRNLIFWSIAAHTAARVKATFIAAGHEYSDGEKFSDASADFFFLLQHITSYSGNRALPHAPRIRLPVLETSDNDFDVLARRNSGILELTWSCWRDHISPCLECHACNKRRDYLTRIQAVSQDAESILSNGGIAH